MASLSHSSSNGQVVYGTFVFCSRITRRCVSLAATAILRTKASREEVLSVIELEDMS